MNSGKRLFSGIHRSVNGLKIVRIPTFSLRFLAFPETVYLGVFSAHRPALLTYSHPVFEILLTQDLLATNVQGTKLIPFPSQDSKNKLLILKI